MPDYKEYTCKICNTSKPLDQYWTNSILNRGHYDTCVTCQTQKNKKMVKMDNCDYPYVVEGAKSILENIGYDLDTPIYLQFNERIRQRWGVELDE